MYIGVSSAWLTSAIRDIIIIALLERKIKQYNLAFFNYRIQTCLINTFVVSL